VWPSSRVCICQPGRLAEMSFSSGASLVISEGMRKGIAWIAEATARIPAMDQRRVFFVISDLSVRNRLFEAMISDRCSLHRNEMLATRHSISDGHDETFTFLC